MDHPNPGGGARAPGAIESSVVAIPMPRRRWAVRIGVPIGVAVCTGALLVASAGEALIPARTVRVVPAVYEREAAPEPEEAAPGSTEAQPRANRVVQAPGWLEAEPFAVACTGLADGVVEEVVVLEGDRVEKGQVVARLVARDAELALARAEADVATAEAEVGIADANLGAATTDWDRPVERERAVAATRAELAETVAELAQLPELIASQRASVERYEEEHNRAKLALESGAANQIEEIIARKRVEEQTGALHALELREGMLDGKRDRLSAEVRAAEQGAELRVEETRALAEARAAKARAEAALALANAQRDEAQLRLERMTIRAPIAGYVQRRLKAPGDKVALLGMDDPESAQIALIYDPEKLQVRVDVPLADASAVYVGQECEVVVDVEPDKVFRGEVIRMAHEADLQKNTVQFKVKVIDPDPLIRPEMLTRVKFLPPGAAGGTTESAPQAPDAVVLEESGMERTGDSTGRIWVVQDRRGLTGDAHPVDVEVVSIADGRAHVRGDVRAGDLVVIGETGLHAGQRVRFTEAGKSGGAR